jgi:hypothetical protein
MSSRRSPQQSSPQLIQRRIALHNKRFAAVQLVIAALWRKIIVALQNISHTIYAALQLDIIIALH